MAGEEVVEEGGGEGPGEMIAALGTIAARIGAARGREFREGLLEREGIEPRSSGARDLEAIARAGEVLALHHRLEEAHAELAGEMPIAGARVLQRAVGLA